MALNLGLKDTNMSLTNNSGFDLVTKQARSAWQGLLRDINGATAIEYGLLAGLVAVGLAGGLGALADLVNLLFDGISEETTNVATSLADP